MTGSRLRAAPFLCPPLPLSPGRPPPTPSFHRSFLPAGSLSKAPPAPAPSTSPLYCLSPRQGPHPQVPPAPTPPDPSSPPLLPPSGAPSPRHLPHQPLPAPTSLALLLHGGAPSPKHHLHRPSKPLFTTIPFSRQGTPEKFLSTSCLPSLAGSLRRLHCQKQTWKAAFRRLPVAPRRFWVLSGLFRVLFGLFRAFFEKSWAKNFPFSPTSGIMKPLTGTARR